MSDHRVKEEAIRLKLDKNSLSGLLTHPLKTIGVVVFAHGSGSSHRSPRNIQVARALSQNGMLTLLFDLLTPKEGVDRGKVFNIPLLARIPRSELLVIPGATHLFEEPGALEKVTEESIRWFAQYLNESARKNAA